MSEKCWTRQKIMLDNNARKLKMLEKMLSIEKMLNLALKMLIWQPSRAYSAGFRHPGRYPKKTGGFFWVSLKKTRQQKPTKLNPVLVSQV
jgi:hypothetical protein